MDNIFSRVAYFFISLFSFSSDAVVEENNIPASLYAISMQALDGSPLALEQFRGKVLLIVNTASQCGFTSQYKGLENIYARYKEQGFLVLGVPSNDFGGQEPGTEREIQNFCENTFGVSFPMTEKLKVKGSEKHPLYVFLTQRSNERRGEEVRWNFEKFLVSRDGKILGRFTSPVEPESEELTRAIEASLL